MRDGQLNLMVGSIALAVDRQWRLVKSRLNALTHHRRQLLHLEQCAKPYMCLMQRRNAFALGVRAAQEPMNKAIGGGPQAGCAAPGGRAG